MKKLNQYQKQLRKYFLVAVIAFLLQECSRDEVDKNLPGVITIYPTDVTVNSAVLKGEITDNGNSKIITCGFVYSKVLSVPTLGDSKIESSVKNRTYSIILENLTPSTKYYVRAYATNGVGASYGEVIEFTTANEPPSATGVAITGSVEVNEIAHASYTYQDAEGDQEVGTTFQWYVSDDFSGTAESPIEGATLADYTIKYAQENKYIRVGVTPKAATGAAVGIEIKSPRVKVGEVVSVTFIYDGHQVTYGIITSPTTGRRWLDRNLGAQNVASSMNDYNSYGDLFQWGRGDDGHQVVARTGPADGNANGVNGTTNVQSSNDHPQHNKFILVNFPCHCNVDWRLPKNDNLWQGVNGINNPCPIGWRVPTDSDWSSEKLSSSEEGYNNLRLTLTGWRDGDLGEFRDTQLSGFYWTSTVSSDAQYTRYGYIAPVINPNARTSDAYRGTGNAVRCILDE